MKFRPPEGGRYKSDVRWNCPSGELVRVGTDGIVRAWTRWTQHEERELGALVQGIDEFFLAAVPETILRGSGRE